jgi:hypothetical protein
MKARTDREVLKTRERRGGLEERGERRKREIRWPEPVPPLLFVFGSARANQTTGDQNSIPCLYSFFG